MRSRVSVVKWPLRNICGPGRQISTTARGSQASEGGLEISPKPVQSCPVQGIRARSTHAAIDTSVFDIAPSVKSWDDVPGPRPLPLLGNTWRFTPYIGGYSVEHIDKVCLSLRAEFGNCVKVTGLLGRPDMLFVFDASEVERVFRGEDAAPHRPSMPSLNYYKHTLRKDFFGAEENCAGVIAVHGEQWSAFRTKVSRVALSAGAAAQYTVPVAEVADAFIQRLRKIRDENSETPSNFLNEVHKWSLESLGLIALDTRLNCFEAPEDSESMRLIHAVQTFFLSVGELELRAPWWRLYPTKMFRQYVAALDTILSVTLRHVEKALKECEANGSSKSLLQDLVAAAGPRVAAVAALDLFLVGIDTVRTYQEKNLMNSGWNKKRYERRTNTIKMRSRVSVVKWPLRNICGPGRQISTTARGSQASEGGLEISPKPVQSCPVQGIRARSTHAAIDTSVFDIAPSVKSWDDVPGPRPLPLLGNTWRFTPYIGGYSVEHIDKVCLSLRAEFGNCVKVTGLLGRPDMLFVFDASEVERVFRGEDAAPHRPSMPSLNYYKHTLRKDFFGAEENCAGVIAVHGEQWSAFRTKVSRVALSAGAAAQYTVPVAEVADAFIQRLRKIRDENSETPSNFLNEVHKWSLESLGLIALDTRLNCFEAPEDSESMRLIHAVQTFFLSVGELELRAPWWRLYPTKMFRQYVAALDTILSVTLRHVEKALKECEANGSSKSLLQDLVAAAGPRVAAVAALDLFLVGIDTTSNAVASILYQLSLRPSVQERLYEEIHKVLQDRPMKPGDVNQMPYLKACVKEVMRMYPVVIGNGRQLTKDTVICGYNIPKGTQVIFQHYVMGNCDDYFTNASEFRPERWMNRSPSQKHHAFASLPFGYGKRMCLGRRFAELEIHTVICKMVQAFKMEYHHEPMDYHIHPMYTPNGPIRLKLTDR